MKTSFEITPATPEDQPAIEHLLDLTFGPARRTKTSYRLREGASPADGLSQVIREAGTGVVGAISFWPLVIGANFVPALLLGPLAVHPERQNIGIGRALMASTLEAAKKAGHGLVILVGDLPYYSRLGFQQVPPGQLLLPGPVDPERLLYLELVPGSLAGLEGLVLPAHRRTK